jgi:hypothetical protein
VGHFPSPEHDVDLDLETFGQQLFGLADPDIKIMLGDLLRELDLFSYPALGRLAPLFFFLLQLVAQLAVIGDAGDRRLGSRRDQDEIEPAFAGEP